MNSLGIKIEISKDPTNPTKYAFKGSVSCEPIVIVYIASRNSNRKR